MKGFRYIRIVPKETPFIPFPPAIYSVEWSNEINKNKLNKKKKKRGLFYSYEYASFGLVIDYKNKWQFWPAFIIEIIKDKYNK